MKNKSLHLKQLWQKVRSFFSPKLTPFIDVPRGGCALIFPDKETYQELINGLADAKSWTGYNYPEKVLDKSTFVIN